VHKFMTAARPQGVGLNGKLFAQLKTPKLQFHVHWFAALFQSSNHQVQCLMQISQSKNILPCRHKTPFLLPHCPHGDHALTSMSSFDIDSMYQNMDQDCVIRATSEEIGRAASIVVADGFFVVLGTKSLGNRVDQCFWHCSESGLDPTDQTISSTKDKCSKGQIYPLQNIINILEFLVRNSYITLGTCVHHQVNGIPQGGHSSGHLANLTFHNFERKGVENYPFHRLQFAISCFMDNFGIANAPYFRNMYRDIYPEQTGIRLVPNQVVPQPEHLVECKLLDALAFVDLEGKVHTTLYDKRDDYKFFVNRFPDIDLNVSRAQSISTFYGELVRLFRLNSHPKGFFSNVGHVAAYLIYHKR
jgi:hypothetical protein